MINEQKNVFAQILNYIDLHTPDAVIIAGDIYDRAIPSTEAVEVFDDFLTDLAGKNIAIIIIAGNHDSPERLNFASRLLTNKQIFFCGKFNKQIEKVILQDKYGSVNFWLLPFIKPSMINVLNTEIETYDDAVKFAIETGEINLAERNVLVSHQFYTKNGGSLIRSDSELDPVGGLDAVSTEIIKDFDYVALGHLHGSQSSGEKHINYCGSPLKYSFSEIKQNKSVILVNLDEKTNGVTSIEITKLPLTPIYDMNEIKGDIYTLLSPEFYETINAHDYLRVIITNDEEIIDPLGKLRNIYPNIMALDFENSKTSIDINSISTDEITIKKSSTYELFTEFFLDSQGITLSQKQEEIVFSILELLERSDTV